MLRWRCSGGAATTPSGLIFLVKNNYITGYVELSHETRPCPTRDSCRCNLGHRIRYQQNRPREFYASTADCSKIYGRGNGSTLATSAKDLLDRSRFNRPDSVHRAVPSPILWNCKGYACRSYRRRCANAGPLHGVVRRAFHWRQTEYSTINRNAHGLRRLGDDRSNAW